jgi:TPR repeat protein
MNKTNLLFLSMFLFSNISLANQTDKETNSENTPTEEIKFIANNLSAEENFEIGQEYFDAEVFDEAFIYFHQAAQKNHLIAQYRLAWMKYKGIGCEKDFITALHFCKLACARKFNPAIQLLKEITTDALIFALKKLQMPIQINIEDLLTGLQGHETQDKSEEDNTIEESQPPFGMYI